MKSIIDRIYADNYSGAKKPFCRDDEKQRSWNESTMFYEGFCLGAHLMLEIMLNPDLE